MYKHLNVSTVLSNLEFVYVNHRYSTRQLKFLTCSAIKTEFGRKSMSFIGPSVYNKLPIDVRNCNNMFHFKKLLKLYMTSLIEIFFT